MHIFSALIRKKIKRNLSEGEIDMGERVETRTLTAKTRTIRTLYVYAVLNGAIFRQISCDILSYARHFQPVRFFLKYCFNELCLQLLQNITDITWTNE